MQSIAWANSLDSENFYLRCWLLAALHWAVDTCQRQRDKSRYAEAMRKLVLATLGLASALGAAEMVGWISDAACGVANANGSKSARECASACIKGGSKPVFVSDKDQKVYQLSDPAKAARFLDKKVKVSGTVTGEKIELAAIAYVD